MRRTITPFLVTGVVLAGAATVVANPVIAPPSDIRVSVSDVSTGGQQLDILDPVFLESIGAMTPDWPTAVATLNALLADLAEDATSVSPQVLADALERFADVPLPAEGATREEAHEALRLTTPQVIKDPAESTVVVMRALANLGSGINQAANTLVEQVTMTPALILSLTEQVLDGTLSPTEALRRLVQAPFGMLAVITGDPKIDRVFQNTVLQPILDALDASPQAPIETGGPDRGPSVAREAQPDDDTSISAAEEQNPLGSDGSADATESEQTAAAAPTQQPAIRPGAAPTQQPAGTPDDGIEEPSLPDLEQNDMTERIRERLQQAIDDLGETVKRITGTDDPEPADNGPAGPQGGDKDSGSTDGGSDDGPTGGVGRG